MNRLIVILIILLSSQLFSQGYTSFFTGNSQDAQVTASFGVCLMGGNTENDQAMIWLLQKANGGDVVVLRTSGSDGYNNYLFSQLGVNVNSVETLVINSAAGAIHPYVLDKVSKAELIWLAGGNQANYVNYFKDNALGDLINSHINVKNAPIGGTSAGMAILGGYYYAAFNGSLTSAQALSNPFHANMTIGAQDFINIPIINDVITDTHFDNPDRRGRLFGMMARIKNDYNAPIFGIASEEYTAVCIENNGIAKVFGSFPQYQDFAYFVQVNCEPANQIQTIVANTALNWNHSFGAIKAYKVPGTNSGQHTFDLNNWFTGNHSGGTWEHWNVNNGVFNSSLGSSPLDCEALSSDDFDESKMLVYPTLVVDKLYFENFDKDTTFSLINSQGQIVYNGNVEQEITINLSKGFYFLTVLDDQKSMVYVSKIIKK